MPFKAPKHTWKLDTRACWKQTTGPSEPGNSFSPKLACFTMRGWSKISDRHYFCLNAKNVCSEIHIKVKRLATQMCLEKYQLWALRCQEHLMRSCRKENSFLRSKLTWGEIRPLSGSETFCPVPSARSSWASWQWTAHGLGLSLDSVAVSVFPQSRGCQHPGTGERSKG